MKKVLTMLMAIMMVFGTFIVAEAADGAHAYSSSWKLEVASERDNGASLNKAFDGNDKTYYHSWFQSKDGVTEKDACPHTITVTFDKALEISSITYLPRQINGNDKSESGIWKKAEIHGSNDGKTFKKLCDATYDVAKTRAITKTDIPKGSYKAIKFVVTDTVNGYNTIGEIQFIGGGAGASASTTTTTTTSSATAVTSTAVVNNGWKIEASSAFGTGNAIEKAFDGKKETYWHSNYVVKDGAVAEKAQCPHTITVTFDKATEISAVTYLPRQIQGNDKSESGIWKKAEIHGSTDGKNFTKLKDVTYDVIKSRELTTTEIPKASYKAIKIVVTDAQGGYGTAAEITFTAGTASTTTTTTTTTTTPAATGSVVTNNGWKIEASSAVEANLIGKAFDGKKETYWHSWFGTKNGVTEKELCPHTITVTFDKATEITAVTYLPRQIQGNDKSESGIWKKAEIHGSTDGKNFTKLKDVTYDVIKSRELTTTEIPKASYKAIKIVVTDAQGGYGTAAEITFLNGDSSATETKTEEKKDEEKKDEEKKEGPSYSEVKVSDINPGGKYSKDAYEYNSKWDITVSSAMAGAANALFDGDINTMWHSWYKAEGSTIKEKATAPHTVTVIFPTETPVSGVRYFPRQIAGSNASTAGIATSADVYVTTDGTNFTKVGHGDFTYGTNYAERDAKEIKFASVKVKGIRFVITSGASGFGTAGELEILKGEGAEATLEELSKAAKKNNKFITMQIDSLDAKIGDKEVKLVKAPQIVDGRTLVPVRFVSESLGAVVGWNGETREVSIMDGTNVIVLEIDSPYVEVNGKIETLDVPAQIIDNSTMVPIRFVSETLGANVAWDGETRSVTIDTPLTIACWGDSLTAGDGAQGTPYPFVIGQLSGLKTYNLGIGGETALTIAARQGAYDIAFTEDFVIPESGSVVLPLATFKEGTYLSTPDGGQVCPRATSAKWNPCYINGVEGTLSIEVDTTVVPRVLKKATFTRKTKGEPVEVKKGDLFKPSASYVKADINVIYIGANGIWDEDNTNGKNTKEQADKIINMIWKMIENTPDPEKYIVVGFTWSGRDSWSVVDAEMEKAFGDKFVNAKPYLSSEQALKDAGVTPTEADLADIKIGRVPESLRKSASDGTHLNGKGYTLLGEQIYERMVKLGYIVE